MKKLVTFSILFLFFSTVLQTYAQNIGDYAFAYTAGSYTEVTGGTVLGTISNDDQAFVGTTAGGTGTVTGPGFPIGFNFTYHGVTYDKFAVNTNGWIRLATGATFSMGGAVYAPISTSGANAENAICAVARDLQGQTGSELSYLLEGTSPNLCLVIQWKNYRRYAVTGESYNFQIRLYETSNSIKLVYGNFTVNYTSTSHPQVGIKGLLITDFHNRTTTANWTTTAKGTLNTSTCTLSTTVTPPSGTTFTFTTPALLNPQSFAAAPVSSSQISLTFTTNVAGNNVLIIWDGDNTFDVPTGAPPAGGQPFAGGTVLYYGTVSPQPHNGLNSATTYYYKAFSYNGTAYSDGMAASATTLCGTYSAPYSQNYNGTYPPLCWFEAYGNAPNPPAASSAWGASTYFANTSPNTPGVKMNVYSTDNDWLISPAIDLGSGPKSLSYKVAVTHWNTTAPETMAIEDTVFVLYSTNIDPPYAFNKANAIAYYTNTHSPSVTGWDESFDLSELGISGVVRFAFYSVGTGNVPDMDIHFDDFNVFSPASLSGYVYDFYGNPIQGATVRKVSGISTTSGPVGDYLLIPLNSGIQQFECFKSGYNAVSATIDIPASTNVIRNFTLTNPEMTVEPESLFAILGPTESTIEELIITNDGNGDLEWNAEVQFVSNLSPSGPASSPLSYCAGSGGCDEFISNVTLGTINNTSVCSNYADYTSMSTDLVTGQTYSISVLIGPPYYTGDQFGAWIDFDQNGIFDEPRITFTLASNLGTGTFTVPQNAPAGPTTMRIRLDYNHVPEPCGTTTYGEVEDYTVNIVDYSWVKLDVQSGTVPPFGGTQTLIATIDASKTPPALAPGVTYTANVLFTSPSGVTPITVPVTLVVTDGGLKGPEELGLYIVDEATGKFMLKWKYFTLRDLQFLHFAILRNGELIGTTPVSAYEFTLTEPGTYCYKVYAVYEGGVYSEPSNEVCITYPLAPGVPVSNWALLLGGLLIGAYAFYMIWKRS